MKKFIPLWFIALSIFTSSCEKDDLVIFSPGTIYFPPYISISMVSFHPEAQNLFFIPVGRSYILRDSVTGTLDSVVVSQSAIEYIITHPTSGNTPGWVAAQYKINMEIKTNGMTPPWLNATAQCDRVPDHTPDNYFDTTITVYNDLSGLPLFWYPLKTISRNIYRFHATLNIGGIIRSQVHEFATNNGLSPADPGYESSVCYWVRDIGIVKRELRSGSSVKTTEMIRFQ
ncbi:MAG: hypothetical protein IPP31_13015 [Chitinophagaceae bacterium]|nr:hypothetical protein [Chitinophagaceae bacterium]